MIINEINYLDYIYNSIIKEDIKTGNIEKIKFYVEEKKLLNRPLNNGNSLLSMAVKAKQIKIVEYLLEKGAVQFTNIKGKMPENRTDDQKILKLLENTRKLHLSNVLHKEKGTLSSFEEIQHHLEILFKAFPDLSLLDKENSDELILHCGFIPFDFPLLAPQILNAYQNKAEGLALITCCLRIIVSICDEKLLNNCYKVLNEENKLKIDQNFKRYLNVQEYLNVQGYLKDKLNKMQEYLNLHSENNSSFFQETLEKISHKSVNDFKDRKYINENEIEDYLNKLKMHCEKMAVGNSIKDVVEYTYGVDNKPIQRIFRFMLVEVSNIFK